MRRSEQVYNGVLERRLFVIWCVLWLCLDIRRIIRRVIRKFMLLFAVFLRTSGRASYWSASSPVLPRVPSPFVVSFVRRQWTGFVAARIGLIASTCNVSPYSFSEPKESSSCRVHSGPDTSSRFDRSRLVSS